VLTVFYCVSMDSSMFCVVLMRFIVFWSVLGSVLVCFSVYDVFCGV